MSTLQMGISLVIIFSCICVLTSQPFGLKPPDAYINLSSPPSETNLHTRATVTAASSNHFDVLVAFLEDYKLKSNGQNIPLFTYDIGLNATEVAYLRVNYPWTTLGTFNFTHYLPQYQEGVALREYAWKPIIVKEMLDTTTSAVLWLDSGNRLTRSDTVKALFSRIRRDGHITTTSGGTTKIWAHPKTLAFLNAPNLNVRMCNAAIVGFDMRAYDTVVAPWAECASVPACLAPPGSSRANHRQDQSVLTVLLHKAGRQYDTNGLMWIVGVIGSLMGIGGGYDTNGGLGVLIHQDKHATAIRHGYAQS
jgi:hypothetical protein